jgi:hypothetical protein
MHSRLFLLEKTDVLHQIKTTNGNTFWVLKNTSSDVNKTNPDAVSQELISEPV